MVDDEKVQKFTKQLELFQKGFDSIAKNINTQLETFLKQTEEIKEKTDFLPKIMKSNKDIKKFGEKLELMIDTLMARLDRIASDKNM